MSIWFKPVTMEHFSKLTTKNIHAALGIQFTEIGEDFLRGTMPVDDRTKQPYGILHGGASCVLAESLGSSAGYLCVDPSKNHVVGLDIHTTHIRSVNSGIVIGAAKPVHLGRSVQVWEIKIENEAEKLVSLTRLTLFVKENEKTK